VPRRNFERKTASLRQFLQTGILGPISFDLALLDIAALLGPPGWWLTDVYDFPFPLNWGYSDLEISFSPETPHRIEFFKINPDRVERTRFHSFCPLLRLSLDDLPIQGRPSAILNSGTWELDTVEIGIHPDPGDPKLSIDVQGVELLYAVVNSDAERFRQGDVNKTAALLDECAFLLGIYAFPGQASGRNRWPNERWHTMPARDYLQIVLSPVST
jgi:hypothetical protein